MIRRYLIGFSLVLMLTSAQAQIKSAFIVNKSGDTLRGEVRFPQSTFHPDRIIFKQSAGAEVTYTPGMIRGFGDSRGAVYESHLVARNTAGYGKVTESRTVDLKTENLFLRKIFEGAAGLLVFTESSGRNHFYLSKEGNVLPLISHKYLIVSYSAVADTRDYILTLRNNLGDCPSVQISDKLAYTEAEISGILKKYSNCRGVQYVKNSGGGGLPAFWGLTGSFAKHRWITRPDPFETWRSSYGLFIETDLPSRKGKWTLFSELIYQRHNPYGWQNLRVTLMPRYYLKDSGNSVFIQTGFAFAGGLGFFNVFGDTGSTAYTTLVVGAGMRLMEIKNRPVLLDGRVEYGAGNSSKILSLSAGLSVALNRAGK